MRLAGHWRNPNGGERFLPVAARGAHGLGLEHAPSDRSRARSAGRANHGRHARARRRFVTGVDLLCHRLRSIPSSEIGGQQIHGEVFSFGQLDYFPVASQDLLRSGRQLARLRRPESYALRAGRRGEGPRNRSASLQFPPARRNPPRARRRGKPRHCRRTTGIRAPRWPAHPARRRWSHMPRSPSAREIRA